MCSRIYVSVPVNISRNVTTDIKRLCPDSDVIIPEKGHRADDYVMLKEIMAGNVDEIPDLIIVTRPEIMRERDYLVETGYFDTDYRYDTGSFVESGGFVDCEWVLKPVFVMPLLIFHNKDVKNPPDSWRSLLDERFRGKVLCTGKTTPPAILLRNFFSHRYGDQGRTFVADDVSYKGAPVDVNRAVGDGEYEIGIMPLAFAKFSRGANTSFCLPEEGALALPQVMLLKKGYGEDVKKVADYLISPGMQRSFSQNAGFVPVIPDVPVPSEVLEGGMLWDGWDWFIEMASGGRVESSGE